MDLMHLILLLNSLDLYVGRVIHLISVDLPPDCLVLLHVHIVEDPFPRINQDVGHHDEAARDHQGIPQGVEDEGLQGTREDDAIQPDHEVGEGDLGFLLQDIHCLLSSFETTLASQELSGSCNLFFQNCRTYQRQSSKQR